MHAFEKADAPNGQKRRLGGICTTDGIDRQGERILQDNLDWDDFLKNGWFNDNHSSKTVDVLGYPDKTSLIRFAPGDMLPNGATAVANGTWVEGWLLNTAAADQIWELAQALQGTDRTLGFSVEGSIVKRQGAGNKVIAKAKIRNVAITSCPVNVQCRLDVLVRSLQAIEDETIKAMGGGGPPIPLPDVPGSGPTGGRIVAPEQLEGRVKDNAGRNKKRKKRVAKSLSTEQAVAYVQARVPGCTYAQAYDVVLFSHDLQNAQII